MEKESNGPMVKQRKRECRKAERKWGKSKLQIDYQIYKNMLRLYNYDICKAREIFFVDIISRNINNACVLFFTVGRLTNPPTDVTPELLSDKV